MKKIQPRVIKESRRMVLGKGYELEFVGSSPGLPLFGCVTWGESPPFSWTLLNSTEVWITQPFSSALRQPSFRNILPGAPWLSSLSDNQGDRLVAEGSTPLKRAAEAQSWETEWTQWCMLCPRGLRASTDTEDLCFLCHIPLLSSLPSDNPYPPFKLCQPEASSHLSLRIPKWSFISDNRNIAV